MLDAKGIIDGFKRDLTGKTGRQASVLYSSHIFAILLGVITRVISTRALGPAGYGVLAFFITITSLTVLFFRFGLFSSGTLLIAQATEERKERELTGALVLVAFIVGISYAFFVFFISFFIDRVFHTEIGWILRASSFLLVSMPFTFFVNSVGIGANKIEKMSLINVIPKAVYILGALIMIKAFDIEPVHLIILNICSTIAAVCVIGRLYHPLYTNKMLNLREIWSKTREYGFYVYQGEIANQTTYHLDGVFITYFVNTTQLGFYSLAMSITNPMSGLSRAILLSMFKDFTKMSRIPRRVMLYNFIWLAACMAVLVVFGRFIVVLLFTEKFLPAVKLIAPLAVANFFQGLYQPYGFLSAKGKGKWIRNVAHAEAISNVVGNIFLIYFFGAFGAALASAISKFIHWFMLRRYYKRFLREGEA